MLYFIILTWVKKWSNVGIFLVFSWEARPQFAIFFRNSTGFGYWYAKTKKCCWPVKSDTFWSKRSTQTTTQWRKNKSNFILAIQYLLKLRLNICAEKKNKSLENEYFCIAPNNFWESYLPLQITILYKTWTICDKYNTVIIC